MRAMTRQGVAEVSAFLDSNVVLYALGNDEPNGFSHFDSLILASALACGCSTLYSEDLQDADHQARLA